VVALDAEGETVSGHEHTVPNETDLPGISATVEYEQSGTEVTVTLEEMSEVTERVELSGCADGATLSTTGESATVTACERGQSIDVLGVSSTGHDRKVSEIVLAEVPSAGVTIDQDPDGITVTAEELGRNTTRVEVDGCDRTGTLRSEGESTTVEGCPDDPLTLTAHHEEGPPVVLTEYDFETTSSGERPEATIDVTRVGGKVAVIVEETGPNVTIIETTGCGGDLDDGARVVTFEGCGIDEEVEVSIHTE
jgi:hypothetical protein